MKKRRDFIVPLARQAVEILRDLQPFTGHGRYVFQGAVWRDARAGRLPAPVKIGPACTRWNVGAIRRHLAALSGESA